MKLILRNGGESPIWNLTDLVWNVTDQIWNEGGEGFQYLYLGNSFHPLRNTFTLKQQQLKNTKRKRKLKDEEDFLSMLNYLGGDDDE